MSNAIVTVILSALLLAGVGTLAEGSFTAVGRVTDAWQQMQERTGEYNRTGLSAVGTSGTGPQLNVTLENTGSEPLRDYAQWDVLVLYYESNGTYHITYLEYEPTGLPVGNNQWAVEGIYVDAGVSTPEVFSPNIHDPSEFLVVRLKTNPNYDASANNLVVVSTPNGVVTSTGF
jgi:archaellum component FlaF (FlaF/FlaG flagellin family)